MIDQRQRSDSVLATGKAWEALRSNQIDQLSSPSSLETAATRLAGLIPTPQTVDPQSLFSVKGSRALGFSDPCHFGENQSSTLLATAFARTSCNQEHSNAYYFFTSGGYFLRSFVTALLMFFSFFSGLALGSNVFDATPLQTSCLVLGSYMLKSNCPT